MDRLVIKGGNPLKGEVTISGAKNAALPIMFATLLLSKKTILHNVPDLKDISTAKKLLEILGCGIKYYPEKKICVVEPPEFPELEAPYNLVRTMRASILCLGPLLAKRKSARVALPGGCAIGSRPVDLHLKALKKMGAEIEVVEGYIEARCDRLKGAHITFDFPTVGGTENILMAATLAKGETILENAAREPEIVDLANFLNKCGAKIKGHGTAVISIKGVEALSGTTYSVISDRIEAGTYMVAAAITRGEVYLKNVPICAMDAVFEKLREMGVFIEVLDNDKVKVIGDDSIQCVDIITQPYPGFPTDMQAQFMALMCTANGTGIIKETIFENRFMQAVELMRLGADIKIAGDTAIVRGGRKLKGAPVMASDLRASAALVLAGLAAQGTTIVRRIYHLDRGYEYMEKKLSALGAHILREKDD